jgi:hypothetical protein
MTTNETFEFKTVISGTPVFVEAKTSMDAHNFREYVIDYLNIYAGDVRITSLVAQSYYCALQEEAYAYIDSVRSNKESS